MFLHTINELIMVNDDDIITYSGSGLEMRDEFVNVAIFCCLVRSGGDVIYTPKYIIYNTIKLEYL